MLQRIYDIRKSKRVVITGFERKRISEKNLNRQGVFFNFYSKKNGRKNTEGSWEKKFGINIPKWMLVDLMKEILISTGDKVQLDKFRRILDKIEKEVKTSCLE